MEEIRELLSRIDTLTTEELSRLNELINQQFDVVSAADPTAETVAAMDELASGLETARARETAIQEEAAAIALHDLEVPVAAWGLDNHVIAVDDLLGRDEAAF